MFINSRRKVGLQETKLDDLDYISSQNVDIHLENRKQISRRKSGGIALLVKRDLSRYINVIDIDFKLVLWFTISKEVTKTKSEILCGVVYIPPEYSEYLVHDPFLKLQIELNKLSQKYNWFFLFGNYNSRTKMLDDFIHR